MSALEAFRKIANRAGAPTMSYDIDIVIEEQTASLECIAAIAAAAIEEITQEAFSTGKDYSEAVVATYPVRVGQIWEDNDPRSASSRTLRVDSLLQEGVDKPKWRPTAKCTVIETGKKVTILLKRFRSTKNGYRLIKGAK